MSKNKTKKDIQLEYKMETGNKATSNVTGVRDNDSYYYEYVEWLEEKYLEYLNKK